MELAQRREAEPSVDEVDPKDDPGEEGLDQEVARREDLGEEGLDPGGVDKRLRLGVSETIGVGSPNKVTAFEVWLFDKNDIRTVTKVLMSDHAFNDDAIRAIRLFASRFADAIVESRAVVVHPKADLHGFFFWTDVDISGTFPDTLG